jgi:glycerophosphoryl diester phosphodiesterase
MRVFGQERHAEVNALLNRRIAELKVLVISHRGVSAGSAAPNTELAVRGAVRSGADMVEIDVCSSSDGAYYCFHDGYEPELLGCEANLQTLTGAEIDKLRYIHVDRPGRPSPVERVLPLLRKFEGDLLFNIDRSWWRWPHFLKALDALRMPTQILLKCPAWEASAIRQLRKHPVKYPFAPICSHSDDLEEVLALDGLNTVGVELLTESPEHPWLRRDTVDALHERGLFTMASTVTLTTGVPLFGGYDDELAIQSSPTYAFGPLFDLGVDAIQTDWPWLLRDYRDSNGTLRMRA